MQNDRDLPAGEAPDTLAGVRVFVAEDEPILLMTLEDILCELGCTVVGTAGRVTDSLAFVASNAFDVAVLDGWLSDGIINPVVDALLARGIPFVVASGYDSCHFPESFSTAVFLKKPYSDELLGQALLRSLANKPSQSVAACAENDMSGSR